MLRSQAAVACDFVTIDTALLRRFYRLFFIDVTTREVTFGGITTSPTAAWTVQAARNLFLVHRDKLANAKALVRDRGSQFTRGFGKVFGTEGMKVSDTPGTDAGGHSIAQRSSAASAANGTTAPSSTTSGGCTCSWSTTSTPQPHRPHRALQQRPPSRAQTATDADGSRSDNVVRFPAATASSMSTRTPHDPRPDFRHPQALCQDPCASARWVRAIVCGSRVGMDRSRSCAMDDTGRWHRSRTIPAIRRVYSWGSRQLPKLVIVVLAVAACATPTAEQDPSDGERSSPTSATATAPSPTQTTGPTPTTTTAPSPSDTGPPRQTITLVAPNGESVDTQGDVTMSTRETLIEHDLAPTSSAGTAVQVVRAGPEGDCSPGDEGALVFFEGSVGDACEVVLHADGTDGFAPADLVVTIQFEAAYMARWNTSGPRREGCVEPGSTVSDMGVELTADPDVVVDFRVEAGSWFSHDPLGFDFGDASLTGMAIDDDAPIGGTISIRVSAGNPGTQVGDIQPPDVFTWTVADPCDDPVG